MIMTVTRLYVKLLFGGCTYGVRLEFFFTSPLSYHSLPHNASCTLDEPARNSSPGVKKSERQSLHLSLCIAKDSNAGPFALSPYINNQFVSTSAPNIMHFLGTQCTSDGIREE